MKNIYINPLFYIVSLIMLATGFFKPFLFMIIYLIIHEIGHIIAAYILGYRVCKINVFPCGLLTIFNMKINDSIFKDFLIAIAGPLFQIISYHFIKKYYFIHLFLFIFNLIPIYPLDGSKIISFFLYLFFPYKKCNNILFYLSFILCVFIIIYFCFNFNLIYILVFITLFIRVIEFYRNRNYLFNSFIMERLLYDFNFVFVKRINNINNMYKERSHYIDGEGEREYIKKYLNYDV